MRLRVLRWPVVALCSMGVVQTAAAVADSISPVIALQSSSGSPIVPVHLSYHPGDGSFEFLGKTTDNAFSQPVAGRVVLSAPGSTWPATLAIAPQNVPYDIPFVSVTTLPLNGQPTAGFIYDSAMCGIGAMLPSG